MNFPAILDVGIGLVVVFFLLSTICSMLVEAYATRRRWRHDTLKEAVNALLRGHLRGEKDCGPNTTTPPSTPTLGDIVVAEFWEHPEIEPLRATDRNSPGAMEASRFASVVLDIATGQGKYGVMPNTVGAMSYALERAAADRRQKASDAEKDRLLERMSSLLRSLPAGSQDVQGAMRTALAKWFNEAMERTTGTYKRKVQKTLFVIGLIVAVTLNCDTIRISYVLFRDPKLSSAMVDFAKTLEATPEMKSSAVEPASGQTNAPAATRFAVGVSNTAAILASAPLTGQSQLANAGEVKPSDEAEYRASLKAQIKELQKLERMGFPLGWTGSLESNFAPLSFEEHKGWPWYVWGLLGFFVKLIGILATAFAVSLGAPFWFDVLNKLLKLRGGKDGAETKDGSAGVAAAPGAIPPGGTTGATAPTLTGPTRPLPSIGEALRDPTTKFRTAKAYWLAEASRLAYLDKEAVEQKTKGEWRFERTEWFNGTLTLEGKTTDTQAFLTVGNGVAILAFRGTESKKLVDWMTDAQAGFVSGKDYPGRIHTGFNGALASIYEQVEAELKKLTGAGVLLYITGHSLGGALATLCAVRFKTHGGGCPIQGVYTYGSPQVGDAEFGHAYQAALGGQTYRVVNNEDIVTRLPSQIIDYEHVGQMVYIDDAGKLQHDIGFWYRFLNFTANAVVDLKQAVTITARDHGMELYCEHLKKVAGQSEA